MLRVLNVVLDGRIGGIQNRILLTSGPLRERGVETIVAAPIGEEDFVRIARQKGLQVREARIESPKFFNSVQGLLRNIMWVVELPLSIIQIRNIIVRESIDVVHINGLLSVQGLMAGKLTRKPVVWHLIGTIYPQWLVRLFRCSMMRAPTLTIFVSRSTMAYYLGEDVPKSDRRIIHEPLDPRYLVIPRTSMEVDDARKELGLDKRSSVVGFVGNISPVKGLEVFLETARKVKELGGGDYRFLIVGPVPKGHEDHFRSLIRRTEELDLGSDVIFSGGTSDPSRYLGTMDVFLMTSRSEGTPLAILEAMAMEVPVVANDIGGISEQIVHEKSGMLVPEGDIDALARCVLLLIQDEGIRRKMTQNARRTVEEEFSLDKCVADHIAAYEWALKQMR